MRTVGGHNPCLIVADGTAPEADAIVFRGDVPKDTRLLVQDVADEGILPASDMLLLRPGEITNRPLIERCALSGLPLLLFTRGSSLKEISRAVGWFQLAFRNGTEANPQRRRVVLEGGGRLVLIHGGANLRALNRIHSQTLVPVGYEGPGHEVLSVAAGACVVLRRPDQNFAGIVDDIRSAEQALGEPRTNTDPRSAQTRRCVVAASDLSRGHVLTRADLDLRAPLTEGAYEAWQAEELVGRRLLHDVAANQPIRKDWLDGKELEPPPWFSPRPPRAKPT